MRTLAWRKGLAWALVAFFVLGGVMNIVAPPSVADEYMRWGYPYWFNYVTGALELASAWLLSRAATRAAGAVLGMVVMTAALITLFIHSDWSHAVLPALVMAALSIILAAQFKQLKTSVTASGTSH
ncbi:putative membrane protein [Duganella sp. 3397]|uniref:DoxX family protein n=1 Tax=Duganella sp. 3397 TaxID=2817732 RepID=UPI00285C9E90|nr:DoxX family protein [Duganella sp. 3397]MDR7048631.1 putative membrane protein [Duganella sp. 3397]